MDSRTRYIMEAVIGGAIAPVGAYYEARDSMKWMDDYVSNRGLSYSDIKYPALTRGYRAIGAGVSFVSSNIKRLY